MQVRHVLFYLCKFEYHLCGNNALWVKSIFAIMHELCEDNMDLFFIVLVHKWRKRKLPGPWGPWQVSKTSVFQFWNDIL